MRRSLTPAAVLVVHDIKLESYFGNEPRSDLCAENISSVLMLSDLGKYQLTPSNDNDNDGAYYRSTLYIRKVSLSERKLADFLSNKNVEKM